MTITINGTTGISGVDGSAATPAFKGNDSNTGVSFGTDTVTINTGGVARVTTDASGNVGVGTASPSSFGRFAVQTDGGTGVAIVGYSPSTTNGARLVLADNYSSAEVRSVPVAATLSSDMLFRTGNADRLRLDSSGNLGLGVTPSAWTTYTAQQIRNASIYGWSSGNSFAGFAANTWYGGSPAGYRYISSDYATEYYQNAGSHIWRTAPSGTAGDAISFTQAMTLNASGNLLVGTTTYADNAKAIISFTGGSSASRGLVMVSGSTASTAMIAFKNPNGYAQGEILTSGSTTSYNTSSDYRLKENVTPMMGALATVAQLKPCTYTWKVDGSAGQGFIAHELQAVVPDCVTGEKDAVDKDGNPEYQGVDASFLVATLVSAIQEQQAIITQLQADVAALKGAA